MSRRASEILDKLLLGSPKARCYLRDFKSEKADVPVASCPSVSTLTVLTDGLYIPLGAWLSAAV